MNFKVGQSVVCVNNDPLPNTSWEVGSQPKLRGVYTVREVGAALTGVAGIRLQEITLDGIHTLNPFQDNFYMANRFRPVATTARGMEILNSILSDINAGNKKEIVGVEA
jgi:hypothetical protein